MLLAAALLVLVPPVQGPVVRGFDFSGPYKPGHRGVDLAAPPGAAVRASCAGSVAFAGAAGSNGRVVTLLCGRWRVTHLPLAGIAVREGARVGVGERLGTVGAGAGHAGLHLGVRRAGSRSGVRRPTPLHQESGAAARPGATAGRPTEGPPARAAPAGRRAAAAGLRARAVAGLGGPGARARRRRSRPAGTATACSNPLARPGWR